MALTDYERRKVEAIAAWKGEAPGWASRALARVRQPLGRAGARLIPDAALHKALAALDAALDADRQVQRFLAETGAARVEDLRLGPLEECDRLAVRVRCPCRAAGAGYRAPWRERAASPRSWPGFLSCSGPPSGRSTARGCATATASTHRPTGLICWAYWS